MELMDGVMEYIRPELLVLVAVLLLAQIALVLEGVVSQTLIPAVDGTLVPAFEVMTANNAVRNLIRESKAHQLDNVIAQSAAQGMITLDQSILKLAQAGRIDGVTPADIALLQVSIVRRSREESAG